MNLYIYKYTGPHSTGVFTCRASVRETPVVSPSVQQRAAQSLQNTSRPAAFFSEKFSQSFESVESSPVPATHRKPAPGNLAEYCCVKICANFKEDPLKFPGVSFLASAGLIKSAPLAGPAPAPGCWWWWSGWGRGAGLWVRGRAVRGRRRCRRSGSCRGSCAAGL